MIGLTKSAYNPGWPLVDQKATAFSGLTSQLKMTGPFCHQNHAKNRCFNTSILQYFLAIDASITLDITLQQITGCGIHFHVLYTVYLPVKINLTLCYGTTTLMLPGPFQYFLVTLMTCSCLAAIMSTADSALMGASSIVSLDIFKKTLFPSISKKNVVRIGELNSVLVCGLAFLLGMFLSDDQMGVIMTFQNGLLMQLLPAFGFGLYLQVSERPVCCGILAGLISLVILTITGNPFDGYIPAVNVSVFVNFLVVALMCLCPGGSTSDLDVGEISHLVSEMIGISCLWCSNWYCN